MGSYILCFVRHAGYSSDAAVPGQRGRRPSGGLQVYLRQDSLLRLSQVEEKETPLPAKENRRRFGTYR